MAKEQEWFKKIEFDQCNLDEESIDHEVSSDSTTDGQDSTNENSANRVASSAIQAGEKDPEATSFTHNQAENIQKVRMRLVVNCGEKFCFVFAKYSSNPTSFPSLLLQSLTALLNSTRQTLWKKNRFGQKARIQWDQLSTCGRIGHL